MNPFLLNDVVLCMLWKSVLNSLPEKMEPVIIFDGTEGVTVGYYKSPDIFIQSADGLTLQRVSHWMPVPDVPAEDKI